MSSNRPKDTSPGEPPEGDPWAAFGYLVAGVGVYGAIETFHALASAQNR